jgi:hypothetical protein
MTHKVSLASMFFNQARDLEKIAGRSTMSKPDRERILSIAKSLRTLYVEASKSNSLPVLRDK